MQEISWSGLLLHYTYIRTCVPCVSYVCMHFTDGHAACQRLSILSLIAPLAVTDVADVSGHAVSMLCMLITRTTRYCHFSTVANVFQHCTTVIFMLIHFHHYNRYIIHTHTLMGVVAHVSLNSLAHSVHGMLTHFVWNAACESTITQSCWRGCVYVHVRILIDLLWSRADCLK